MFPANLTNNYGLKNAKMEKILLDFLCSHGLAMTDLRAFQDVLLSVVSHK